jgi:hypothetical protein
VSNPTPPMEAYLDFDQIVELLRMSPSWVRKATARGDLPSIHFGRRALYDPVEICRNGMAFWTGETLSTQPAASVAKDADGHPVFFP